MKDDLRKAADGGPDHLNRIRNKSRSQGIFRPYNKSFCQTCKMYKPKITPLMGGEKKFADWKCDECKAKK